MVVLARGPGCPSRHEPARSQGFRIPADNFPNELARVCDSVGKSPPTVARSRCGLSFSLQVRYAIRLARPCEHEPWNACAGPELRRPGSGQSHCHGHGHSESQRVASLSN